MYCSKNLMIIIKYILSRIFSVIEKNIDVVMCASGLLKQTEGLLHQGCYYRFIINLLICVWINMLCTQFSNPCVWINWVQRKKYWEQPAVKMQDKTVNVDLWPSK